LIKIAAFVETEAAEPGLSLLLLQTLQTEKSYGQFGCRFGSRRHGQLTMWRGKLDISCGLNCGLDRKFKIPLRPRWSKTDATKFRCWDLRSVGTGGNA